MITLPLLLFFQVSLWQYITSIEIIVTDGRREE
jgi:hypothetical protein